MAARLRWDDDKAVWRWAEDKSPKGKDFKTVKDRFTRVFRAKGSVNDVVCRFRDAYDSTKDKP